jgi:type I restriction enzyme, R subunit
MASNFDFLQAEKPDLFGPAQKAEALAHQAPRAACFYARFALETTVHWLYDNDQDLSLPYDHKLGALIHEQSFKDNLPGNLFPKVRTVLMMGNHAAHKPAPLAARDSVHAVKELFHFLYWVSRMYSADASTHPHVTFDRALLPKPQQQQDLSQAQLQELESKLEQSSEMARIKQERLDATEAELAELKQQVADLKKQNESVPDEHDYNEDDTRVRFVDVLLQEAAWDPHAPNVMEFPVSGMPVTKRSPKGNGKVDYVLWGSNGLPLAVIETKRTRYSPEKGKRQAELYAEALEKMYGQRPVIFYSNGYEHRVWDDARGYPPREIHGFLRKEELEVLIHRRTSAKKLSLVQVNQKIAGRSYQIEAIRRITDGLTTKSRRHLLVMATGTGKTRTAIALVDLLKRAEWVKRVLFLADRSALLTQAKRAFKEHLPSAMAVDITEDKSGTNATIVLSTYPTMMNRIDDLQAGGRPFGVGQFDLVIVDEAHRSIYKKYRALFEYFDAMLIGLTATPRSEVHRDTYRIFGLEQGVPTFAYELCDAVVDGYLVPPKGVSAPFKFLQEGVRYDELSEEDQEEYEEKLVDPESGVVPDHVSAVALNKWLFNEDTVDKALALLMDQGLKVHDGDRLGKTIIFGRNHNHAEFIVKRFDEAYPQLAGKFARVIDSHNDYAQTLLDDFSEAQKNPIIAVSVDMLDTGIDVPEVMNLVFFKPVRSRVKFNQMIGRGTRLCEDLLGHGQHKEEFLVFDLCANFEFFSEEIREPDQAQREGLDAQLVRARLSVVHTMDCCIEADDEQRELRGTLLDDLHQHVATMNLDSFMVRKHRALVEEFSNRQRWNQLTLEDQEQVLEKLAPLPNGLDPENFKAKQFDVLCYRIMVAALAGEATFEGYRDRVRDLAHKLEEKQAIPMVQKEIELIHAVQDEDYWTDITLPMLDQVRRRLRGLIQFIEKGIGTIAYTDFEDEVGVAADAAVPIYQTGFSPWQYKKKVEAYIRDHEHHLAIAKIKRGHPLTAPDLQTLEALLFNADELGTRGHFEMTFGKDLSLPLFIRKLVGLDRAEAKTAFSGYLDGVGFSANQVRFVETMINYLTKNGVMDPGLLYEPPFSDIHHDGLDGVFGDKDADKIVSIVRNFNTSVDARFVAS